jgi:phosphoenolpyruvate-protein kinase (PTS system EI component)
LDELSMSPRRIPAVKRAIRAATFSDAQTLVTDALRQPDADHVARLLDRLV